MFETINWKSAIDLLVFLLLFSDIENNMTTLFRWSRSISSDDISTESVTTTSKKFKIKQANPGKVSYFDTKWTLLQLVNRFAESICDGKVLGSFPCNSIYKLQTQNSGIRPLIKRMKENWKSKINGIKMNKLVVPALTPSKYEKFSIVVENQKLISAFIRT